MDNAKADFPDKIIGAFTEEDIEDPTFMDDDDERTPTFYVDIPPTNGGDEWVNVESFKTEEEAVMYARRHFGADENGMICIISKS